MHVLITGGAGFIGSHLVELHLARGDKVHVVDDLSTGSMDNVNRFIDQPNYHFDSADLLTWPQLERVAAWADRIYHLAAVVGVYRVLAAAEESGRVRRGYFVESLGAAQFSTTGAIDRIRAASRQPCSRGAPVRPARGPGP